MTLRLWWLKVGTDGTPLRVKDVGGAEVGAQDYSATALFDGSPSVALLVYQLPGTNAWNTAKLVKAKIAELEPKFPPGLKATIGLDNTLFVAASLEKAFKTLTEAIALVFLLTRQ